MHILGGLQHIRHIGGIDDIHLYMHVYFDGKREHQTVLTFKEIVKTSSIRVFVDNRETNWGLSEILYLNNYVFRVKGWCYSEVKLDTVRIFINNKYIGETQVNVSRADVYKKFEDCLENDCGFVFEKVRPLRKTFHLLLKFYFDNVEIFILGQSLQLEKISQNRKKFSTFKFPSFWLKERTRFFKSKRSVPDVMVNREGGEMNGRLYNRLEKISKSVKKGNARSALIYCADITGHRHLHSAYFIRFLLNRGYVVYFCYAGRVSILISRGRMGYKRLTSPYLEVFQENPRVHFIDICDELSAAKNELNFIVKLQRKLEPTVSLFIDGDILKYTLLKQLLPWQKRLSGLNFSTLCLSEFIYLPVGRFQVLKELWLFIYHQLTNPIIFFHRVEFVETFPLLNKLFFYCLCRFNLLTAAFCPDAKLVNMFKHRRVLFLPELVTGHLEVKITGEKASFYNRIKSHYIDFLEKHSGKHVLLMFGDLESRKGYDLLLQLAAHYPDCICARFGRTKKGYSPTWETIVSKEKLLMEDRLFEVDTFIESKELVNFIFSTVGFMILPYKKYYRTSSVLIEVLRRGLPVLTSDNGVMAYIVKYYRVGRVFRDDNLIELQRAFAYFKQNYKVYLKNIEKFNITYSNENIEKILAVMLEKKEPVLKK